MLPLLLAASGLFIAPGQNAPPAQDSAVKVQQRPIEHQVAVTLKLIQVYVVDRRGDPVGDLTREEFIVFDNGERKSLTEFERHSLSGTQPGSKRSAAGAPRPAPQPSAPPAAIPAAGAPADRTGEPALARKYFLFFDFAFNNQRGARKSIDAAAKFLEKDVKPGDEVGLVTYSLTRGMSIHEFLTTDHDKVREALGSIARQEDQLPKDNRVPDYNRPHPSDG